MSSFHSAADDADGLVSANLPDTGFMLFEAAVNPFFQKIQCVEALLEQDDERKFSDKFKGHARPFIFFQSSNSLHKCFHCKWII